MELLLLLRLIKAANLLEEARSDGLMELHEDTSVWQDSIEAQKRIESMIVQVVNHD